MANVANLDTANVKIEKPDTSFNPDITLEESIKKSYPEYAGDNPYWLRKQLIHNPTEFEKVSQKFFQDQTPDNKRTSYESDPELLATDYNRFKSNFREYLVDRAFSGDPISKSLVDQTTRLISKVDDIAPHKYNDVLKNNKDKYLDYGLVDQKGNPVFKNESALANHLIANPDILREINVDRYQQFEDELAKHHNSEALFDSKQLIMGWVIYDQFGPEVLTNYVNETQNGTDPEKGTSLPAGKINEKLAEFVGGERLDKLPSKGKKFASRIKKEAMRNGVPAYLLAGIIKQESNFDPDAENDKSGAAGLMQLMADTATGDLGMTEEERFDPDKNISGGAKHLARLFNAYPDWTEEQVLAAYNWGEGNLSNALEKSKQEGRDWKEYLPEETSDYIVKVSKNAEVYKSGPGQLTFKPITPREDITRDVPRDMNAATATFAYEEKDGETVEKAPEDIATTIADKYFPEEFKNIDIPRLKEDGDLSEDMNRLTWALFETAAEGKEYTMQDLMSSLITGATEATSDQGNPEYKLNYPTLSPHQQLIFKALQYSMNAQYMFDDLGYGNYNFRPFRRQENIEDMNKWKMRLFDTETVSVQDELGNWSRQERVETGPIAQMWNSIISLGAGVVGMGAKFVLEPSMRATNKALEAMGADVENSKRVTEELRSYLDISQGELTTIADDGLVPGVLNEAMPFIQYMGAMAMGGRAALSLGAKAAQVITGGKRAMDTLRAGALLPGTRYNLMARKVGQAVSKKRPWVTGGGIFYTGGALIEATQPEQVSFYNVIPQMFGGEGTNDITKLYKSSNDWTQAGMDVLASLAFDGIADTFIGMGVFGGSKVGQAFGKTKFNSIIWDEAAGSYKVTNVPEFKHDLVRFWKNATRGLAELPQGEIGETAARAFDIKTNGIQTLHDFTRVFVDGNDEFMGSVKSEIRNNVEFLQRNLGDGVKLSKEEIDEIAERQYGIFLNKVSDQSYGILKNANPNDPEEFVLRFTQTLDEQTPIVKEFKYNGERINPKDVDTYRDQGHNLIVKGNKVFEVAPNFWTIDLAANLRRKALSVTSDEYVAKKFTQEGIDPEIGTLSKEQVARMAEIESEAQNVIGSVTDIDGRVGYVVDVDDSGFLVRTSAGDVRVKELSNEVDVQEMKVRARDAAIKALTDDAVKLRMQVGNVPPRSDLPERPILRLPSDTGKDPSELEIIQRGRKVNAEISNVENRLKNLDQIYDKTIIKKGKEVKNPEFRAEEKKLQSQLEELRGEQTAVAEQLAAFYILNPKILTQLGSSGKMRLVHYSKQTGLERLDPTKEGTGFPNARTRQGTPDNPVTYFYREGSQGERDIIGGSQSKYVVETNDDFRIYDMGTNPDGFKGRSEEVIAQVRAAGYDGYYTSRYKAMENVVAVFDDVAPTREFPVSQLDKSTGRVVGYTDDFNYNQMVESTKPVIDQIKKASKRKSDGATFNLDGTPYEGTGVVVGIESKNVKQSTLAPSDIVDFVEENLGKVASENVKVGVYKFPNSDMVSIDLNLVVPTKYRQQALNVAKMGGQESVYDIGAGKTLETGLSGENPRSFTDAEFLQITRDLEAGRTPKLDISSGDSDDAVAQAVKLNNGKSLEFTPDGKPSKLYQDMLEFTGGDKERTEMLVAQTYTREFRSWFGDWINDPQNASKVVNPDGTPKMVYHGTNRDFDKFKRIEDNDSGLTEYGTFFTDNKFISQIYAARTIKGAEQLRAGKNVPDAKVIPAFLNIRKMHSFDAKFDQNLTAWDHLRVDLGYKIATNRDAQAALAGLNKATWTDVKVDAIEARNIIDIDLRLFEKATPEEQKVYGGTSYLVFDGNEDAMVRRLDLPDFTERSIEPKNKTIQDEIVKERVTRWNMLGRYGDRIDQTVAELERLSKVQTDLPFCN